MKVYGRTGLGCASSSATTAASRTTTTPSRLNTADLPWLLSEALEQRADPVKARLTSQTGASRQLPDLILMAERGRSPNAGGRQTRAKKIPARVPARPWR